MEIVRNHDGTLVVPVQHERQEVAEDSTEISSNGGVTEALTEWDLQQNSDREPVVSTATGRDQAMSLVHAIATSPDHAVAKAVEKLKDPEASGQALRFVLIGGVHSVEAFADEVTEAKGSELIPAHQMAKIIGEILAKLDQ